jgi:hypothetical protein
MSATSLLTVHCKFPDPQDTHAPLRALVKRLIYHWSNTPSSPQTPRHRRQFIPSMLVISGRLSKLDDTANVLDYLQKDKRRMLSVYSDMVVSQATT